MIFELLFVSGFLFEEFGIVNLEFRIGIKNSEY
jgi:hypothetical protein